MFKAPIVAEQQYDDRRQCRAERDRDQAQREIARRIADEPKDIRTEKPAEIAERVDQRDAAGDTVPVIVDRLTGQVRAAQIFVAVMGASNFTYAEASWTQALADWIGAHTRAFAALGGVPKLLVPDNTKVAVINACLYEPQVNRTYAEMAAHYDTAILPPRPERDLPLPETPKGTILTRNDPESGSVG